MSEQDVTDVEPTVEGRQWPPDPRRTIGRDDPVWWSDFIALTSVSYRRLDVWTRLGHLDNPIGRTFSEERPGSGSTRTWTGRELRIVTLAMKLLGAGFETRYALRYARDAVDVHVNRVTTEDGILVAWEPIL